MGKQVNRRPEYPFRRIDRHILRTEPVREVIGSLHDQATKQLTHIDLNPSYPLFHLPITEFFQRQIPVGSSLHTRYVRLQFYIESNFPMRWRATVGVPHDDHSFAWRYEYQSSGLPYCEVPIKSALTLADIYAGDNGWFDPYYIGRHNPEDLSIVPLNFRSRANVILDRKGRVRGPIRTPLGQSIPVKHKFQFKIPYNHRLFARQSVLPDEITIDPDHKQPRYIFMFRIFPDTIGGGDAIDPGNGAGLYCRINRININYRWNAFDGRGLMYQNTLPSVSSYPVGGPYLPPLTGYPEGGENEPGEMFPTAVWGSGDIRSRLDSFTVAMDAIRESQQYKDQKSLYGARCLEAQKLKLAMKHALYKSWLEKYAFPEIGGIWRERGYVSDLPPTTVPIPSDDEDMDESAAELSDAA